MASGHKLHLSILGRLLILAGIVFISFSVLFIVSVSSLKSLSLEIDRIQNVFGVLNRSSSESERGSYGAELGLYKAINMIQAGYSENDVQLALDDALSLLQMSRSAIANLLVIEAAGVDLSVPMASTTFTFNAYSVTVGELLELAKKSPNEALALIGDADSKFEALSRALSDLNAAVLAAGDAAYARAGATRSQANLLALIVAGACVLFVGVMVWFTIRSITRPIHHLASFIGQMGTGDLSGRYGKAGSDEIGKIAASVDHLAEDLCELVGTVKARVDALEEAGLGLAENMTGSEMAASSITSNVEGARRRLVEQSSAVGEAASSIRRHALNVESLSRMIGDQSGILAESAASVEEMIANVESVATGAASAAEASARLRAEGLEGKARIDETREAVESIVHSSENLTEAAGLIEEIAERTNLLAMNAAIEAAHAGDAGRGFAVVADEIRKLAEQSTERAREIGVDLGRVAGAIGAVKDSSDAAVASFGAILERSGALDDEVARISSAMTEQEKGGRDVLEGIKHLREITGTISSSSEEMAGGNRSMLEQVERLKDANQSVVQNNEEIERGAEEIAQAVASVSELTSQNQSLIAEVRTAADRFKL